MARITSDCAPLRQVMRPDRSAGQMMKKVLQVTILLMRHIEPFSSRVE